MKALNYYQQHGLLRFYFRFFDELGFKYFKRDAIFVHLNLNKIRGDPKESPSFVIATEDDIQREQHYDDGWFGKEKAINRLRSGHLLFVLKESGRIIFFLWADRKSVKIDWFDLSFSIPEDVAYITGVYTHPDFRGRGIASKLKREIFQYLKNEGFKHLIGIVDPSNVIALKIDKKIGFKEYQILNYKRIWFIRYHTVTKFNSTQSETFVSFFCQSNSDIWKCFSDHLFQR